MLELTQTLRASAVQPTVADAVALCGAVAFPAELLPAFLPVMLASYGGGDGV